MKRSAELRRQADKHAELAMRFTDEGMPAESVMHTRLAEELFREAEKLEKEGK